MSDVKPPGSRPPEVADAASRRRVVRSAAAPLVDGWRRLRLQRRTVRQTRRRGVALERRRRARAADLRRVGGGNGRFLAHRDAPIVVMVLRDERLRLPFLLDHYRGLGFAGFVVVDNGSTDGSRELLEVQEDVVLFGTEASYSVASCGVDWQQQLLAEYAEDRWALIVDADEQLVFPGDREEGVRGLIDRAEARGDAAVMAPLVDVYPAGPICEAIYRPGQPFLSVADRFDGPDTHYLRCVGEGAITPHVEVRGGPRLRTMGFALEEAPLLTKFPLARRGRGRAIDSAHLLHPPAANTTSSFGALLHFKYFHDFSERAAIAVATGEQWHDGYEYRKYVAALDVRPRLDLRHAGTRVYTGPDSLRWLWQGIAAVRASGRREFVCARDPLRAAPQRSVRPSQGGAAQRL